MHVFFVRWVCQVLSFLILVEKGRGQYGECADKELPPLPQNVAKLSGGVQLLIPGLELNCLGTISRWKAYVSQTSASTDASDLVEFQVFHPHETLSGVFELVFGNVYEAGNIDGNELTVNVHGNNSQPYIPVDSASVIGIYIKDVPQPLELLFESDPDDGGVDVYYWEGVTQRKCTYSICDPEAKMMHAVAPLVSYKFDVTKSAALIGVLLSLVSSSSYCTEIEISACPEEPSEDVGLIRSLASSLLSVMPYSHSVMSTPSFSTTSSLPSLKTATSVVSMSHSSLLSHMTVLSSSAASSASHAGNQLSLISIETALPPKVVMEPTVSFNHIKSSASEQMHSFSPDGESDLVFTSMTVHSASSSILTFITSTGTPSPTHGHQQHGFSTTLLNNILAATVIGLLILCIVLTCVLILICGQSFVQKTKLQKEIEAATDAKDKDYRPVSRHTAVSKHGVSEFHRQPQDSHVQTTAVPTLGTAARNSVTLLFHHQLHNPNNHVYENIAHL